MRAQNQPEFTEWLMNIGNGILNDTQDNVTIPNKFLEKHDIVKAIYGDRTISIGDESLSHKIILATMNEDANILNERVLNLLEGHSKEYCSADSIISEDPTDYLRYPVEFLYKQQPSGMPPHLLKLKVGAIIMLLRNLDPKCGLLNGTRLIIMELHTNFIIGKIINGKAKNTMAVIPKIDMTQSENILPFVLKRRQFPVIVSYAMTIHKSQEQSFESVGVYLPDPVFTHGQLYVALSRVIRAKNLRIYLLKEAKGKTKNIVFKSLLTDR